MTIAELADLPELGVGIVHTPELAQRLGDGLRELVVEVEPQRSWRQLGDDGFAVPVDELEALRSYVGSTLVHGAGDPVGGTLAAGPGFAVALEQSVAALRPAWVSEHLAFNRFAAHDGVHMTGALMPPVQSEHGVELAAARLIALATRVGRPVAFETGVSYLRPQPWELPDGELVAAVAETADCGIVLDLHNVYANAVNHRQALDEFVATLPLARVIEVHLGGGRGHDGYLLAAHCGPTPNELRALAELVVARLPNLKAIVFELLGQYDHRVDDAALADELAWLESLWEIRGLDAGIGVRRRWTPVARRDAPPPEAWETTLGELVRGRSPTGALARALAADPAIALYRGLVARSRRGAIAGTLPWTLAALRLCDGAGPTHAVLERLLHDTSPAPFESTEALRFAAALAELPLDPLVRDTLAIESASLRARVDGVTHRVQVEHEPNELFAALADRRRPARVAPLDVELAP